METDNIVTLVILFVFFSIGTGILMYNIGKEAGCHVHEFVIAKVECIHCQRRESRFKKDIVERKVNVAPPSPH